VIPRASFRLPLWAALAIAGAVYVVRSLVLRDGDFAPDVPGDVIALVALVVVVGIVAAARRHGDGD
jgi:hypothetical protein